MSWERKNTTIKTQFICATASITQMMFRFRYISYSQQIESFAMNHYIKVSK